MAEPHFLESTPGNDEQGLPVRRKGSWLQTAQAVAWSFLGIRRRAGYDRDVEHLNPVHVIIAGIIGALLFIAVLIVVVKWVIGSGVAAS